MLRQAIQINPGLLGGIGSGGHFMRLLNWFYFGFKLRYKLSKRKISSVGQKLPNDWREDTTISFVMSPILRCHDRGLMGLSAQVQMMTMSSIQTKSQSGGNVTA